MLRLNYPRTRNEACSEQGGRLIAVRKAGVLSYLHHDHLGSTKAISGTTGGPMKYYPFGSTYQEIASPPTDNLYTGQKRDLSTGLYYYGDRYYDGGWSQPLA